MPQPLFHERLSMSIVRAAARVGQRVCLVLIATYQAVLRPHLLGCCKFYPTCSAYAAEAVGRHGVFRGGALALRRLVRCHPFGAGGIDLVPTCTCATHQADSTAR